MTKMTNTKKRAIKIAAKRAAANQPRYRSASIYPAAYDEAMKVIDAINQRRGLGESPTREVKKLTRVKGFSALLRAGASLGVDVIDQQAESIENE